MLIADDEIPASLDGLLASTRDYTGDHVAPRLVTLYFLKSKEEQEATGSKYGIGHGLQLTEDGFVLTSAHVVSKHLDMFHRFSASLGQGAEETARWYLALREHMGVMARDGNQYPLDPLVFIGFEDEDFALVRYMGPGRQGHIPYAWNAQLPVSQSEILLHRYDQGKPVVSTGCVLPLEPAALERAGLRRESIVTTIPVRQGHSGSVLTCPDNRIVGQVQQSLDGSGYPHPVAVGYSTEYVLDFLRYATERLQRTHL